MSDAARKRATYDDVLAAPENMIAEIIDGELVLSPRPMPDHSGVSSELRSMLGDPFGRGRGGPGGWIILFEPEVHLGEYVLVPDLAAWRRTRMAHLPRGHHIDVHPDWVCEVLSPSTGKRDRTVKLDVYGSLGVEFCWLIDPRERTLEAFRFENQRWVRLAAFANDAKARVEPFDAIELELGLLWADQEPLPSP